MKKLLFLLLGLPLLSQAQQGIISTVAGTVASGFTGDGGPATQARLNVASDVVVDIYGNLFISDATNSCIRVVTNDTITTFAGNRSTGCAGSVVPATSSSVNQPQGIALNEAGNLFITDQAGSAVNRVNGAGLILRFAGLCGTASFGGDAGPASLAKLNSPSDVVADKYGNVYIADAGNNRIRKVDASGTIYSYAGNGAFGFSGDGGSARAAGIGQVVKMAVDGAGNLYFTDATSRIRKIDRITENISTICGTGAAGYSGDGSFANAAKLNNPNGIAIDGAGNIYIADRFNNRIRKIDLNGMITTIAGSGTSGYTGDGGASALANISFPSGLCTDKMGNLYFNQYPSVVRRIFYNAAPPRFINSHTQAIVVCDSIPLSLDSILAINDADSAQAVTWRPLLNPTHGTLNANYFRLTTSYTIQPSSLIYSATHGYAGIDSFSIIVSDGHCNDTMVFFIGVRALPQAGPITGSSTVCDESNITLTRGNPGGVWSSSNAAATVSTVGVVTGVTAGLDTIYYVITDYCGIDTASKVINVLPLPYADTISGPSALCVASTITLTDTSTGGTWAVLSSHASISTSGVVTGVMAGVDTIVYNVTTTCGTSIASKEIAILPLPDAGIITGATVVCESAIDSISDTASGGTWAISNGNASLITLVTGRGITGISAGLDTVFYSVTNSCGTAVATHVITINPLPVSGGISGASVVCEGSTETLTDTASGGTWYATSGHVTVMPTSASAVTMTGLSAGADTVVYSVTNSCGTSITMHPVTVNPLPHAGVITGASVVCEAATDTLDNATGAGTWTISNSNATIIAAGTRGIIAGVSAGLDTVSYSVTNSCGTDVTYHVVTVNPLPHAGSILGVAVICESASDTLTSTVGGGTWSMSNDKATLLPLATGKLLMGINAGLDTVLYAITNSCGTDITMHIVTVSPLPHAGSITGATVVCEGNTETLDNTTTGGSWTISNTNASLTITATGSIITGVSAGLDTVYYSVTNSCGTDVTNHIITINPLPHAGTITGAAIVCEGSADTLTNSITGGSWSLSNTNATLLPTAPGSILTGVTPGTDTAIYSVTNSCGTDIVTHIVTINPLPHAGSITGSLVVCEGSADTLTNSITGGSWTLTNTNASIVAISTGSVITGILAGTDTAIYAVTNSCGTDIISLEITINPLPHAGTISGAGIVCEASTDTLSNPATGGTWTMSNTNATIFPLPTGSEVLGVTAGTDTAIYTVTNSCGTDIVTKEITVNPLPHAGFITGTATICEAATSILNNSATGGTWSVTNANAGVTPLVSGSILTGINAGEDTVLYTVTNSCGTDVALHQVTVNPLPRAGFITGSATICESVTDTFSNTVSSGTWSISNTNATILPIAPGISITGVVAGLDTVSYTVTNSCGTDVVSHIVTVNPLPHAGVITGRTVVCETDADTLTNAATGGIWTMSNTHATIVPFVGGSIVSAISAGVDTAIYTVTNSCGTDIATHIITINPLPHAGAISGISTICEGSSDTLLVFATGGTWSSSNANASLLPLGSSVLLTAVAQGLDTIVYTVSNSCGTAISSRVVSISPLPRAGTITGIATVCEGSTITFSGTATGGTWVASNGNATVFALTTGSLVTGVQAGMDTIYYSVSNSCGVDIVSKIITVDPLPHAGVIVGADSICIGVSTLLTDTAKNGIWVAGGTNAFITTTAAGCSVFGVNAGVDNVMYIVTNSCGKDTASHLLLVKAKPDAGTINAPASICVGDSVVLTDTLGSGLWTVANGKARVAGNILIGNTAGKDTIIYTVNNSCGWDYATHVVTVNPLPDAGRVTGPGIVCINSEIVLSASVSSGTWSTENTNATVTNGIVKGIYEGYTTIAFTVSNNCGIAKATLLVEVDSCITLVTLPNHGIVRMFPSPTHDIVTIKSTYAGDYDRYVITTMDGSVIRSGQMQGAEMEVSLKDVASGMYFIRVIGLYGTWSERIVKD